jgi:SAM-dependent methyltransferase
MTDGHDAVVIDWDDKAERLSGAATDDAAWYAEMAAELVRPGDRVTVDVGCGGAGMALAMGEVLDPGGQVIGIDGNDEILAAAHRRIVAAGIDDRRIQLIRADLDDDLGARPELAMGADLVWASASVHHVGDQQQAIDRLAGLLAPGGRLALAEGGLPKRHLPWDVGIGRPGLEVRLLNADDRWFARMRAALPGSVPMPYGWPTALRHAGLTEVTTRTTLFESTAPLEEGELAKVIDSLSHRVERAVDSGELDGEDAAAWSRLLDPDDSAWLGGRADVYALSARSVHRGVRPG